MIVITMTNCPAKLRGDLSKWLCEVNTGVYVGNLSARVRDALWNRICENIRDGQATMVYTAQNEQHFEFRAHNTTWKVRDFDGIKLMMRPKKVEVTEEKLSRDFSKASKRRIAMRRKNKTNAESSEFVFIDIETTGLDTSKDKIIEIAALTADEEKVISSWNRLIKISESIPPKITELTGITDENLSEGVNLKESLCELSKIVKGKTVVCYNRKFDIVFLQNEFRKNGINSPFGRVIDMLFDVRKKIEDVKNYKLETLAEYFGIDVEICHRASADCDTLYRVFLKLNEI